MTFLLLGYYYKLSSRSIVKKYYDSLDADKQVTAYGLRLHKWWTFCLYAVMPSPELETMFDVNVIVFMLMSGGLALAGVGSYNDVI